MRQRVKFLFLLFLQCALAMMPLQTQEEVPEATPEEAYRLPTAITPENYKLEVTTFLNDSAAEGFSFTGVVEILVSNAFYRFRIKYQ